MLRTFVLLAEPSSLRGKNVASKGILQALLQNSEFMFASRVTPARKVMRRQT